MTCEGSLLTSYRMRMSLGALRPAPRGARCWCWCSWVTPCRGSCSRPNDPCRPRRPRASTALASPLPPPPWRVASIVLHHWPEPCGAWRGYSVLVTGGYLLIVAAASSQSGVRQSHFRAQSTCYSSAVCYCWMEHAFPSLGAGLAHSILLQAGCHFDFSG